VRKLPSCIARPFVCYAEATWIRGPFPGVVGRERESVDALSPSCRRVSGCREHLPKGVTRTVLVQMAQVWQRLAEDYGDSSAALSRPTEAGQLVMQQQQQIQSDDDKKE